MTVTATHLTTATDTTNASPWTTASITPTANRLVLATVGVVGTATAASTPTLSGCGLTWVLVATTGTNVVHEVALFRAMGASPTSGAVTITSTVTSPTRCNWSITEFDGVDTSGTNGSGAIVQSITAKPTAVTSVSQAFSAGITSGNGSFGGVDINVGEAFTAGTGWTALGQATVATPAGAIIGMAGTSGVGVSPIAASWTTSTNAWVVGAEIKAAAAAAVGLVSQGLRRIRPSLPGRHIRTATPSIDQAVAPVQARRANQRRPRMVARRRPAQPVPTQIVVTPPSYVPPVMRRAFKGLAMRRRARVEVVPPQVAATPPPPYVPVIGRRGLKGWQPRRRTRIEVVPPQVAATPPPPYVPTIPRKAFKGLTTRRRPARAEATHPHAGIPRPVTQKRIRPGMLPARRRSAEPVPPQLTPAQPIARLGTTRRGFKGWQPRRRTRVEVTPPQIAATPPPRHVPSPPRRGFKGWQPRRRILSLLGFPPAAPVVATAPYIELIIPARLGTLEIGAVNRTLLIGATARALDIADTERTLTIPAVTRTLEISEV